MLGKGALCRVGAGDFVVQRQIVIRGRRNAATASCFKVSRAISKGVLGLDIIRSAFGYNRAPTLPP